jgi:hypothetical protein
VTARERSWDRAATETTSDARSLIMTRYNLLALTAAGAFGLATPGVARAQALADTTRTIAEHEFVVSGFVGPTFGADVDDVDTGLGGAFTYLHGGMFGAEFIANVTPDLNLDSDLIEDGNVNSFMFNGVAALPLGEAGRWPRSCRGGSAR